MSGLSTISDYDRHHIYEILIGDQSWFGAKLIRLISVADGENKAKLFSAFPDYVQAYDDWFFKRGIYANRKDEL